MYTLFIIILILFVNAVGLTENDGWETNLTKVRFSTVALGDLNNDNKSDLVLTGCIDNASSGQNCNKGVIAKIYINNGTSLLENSSWSQNLTGIGHGSTALGDIDNDGKLDLAITGCTSATSASGCTGNRIAKIYINNGTSLLENSSWSQNLTGLWSGNLALGDIDNDGRLDLASMGQKNDLGGQITKIYINNGSALVESSVWQNSLTAVDDGSLTFADVDNDGWLDIGLTGDDSSNVKTTKIYINNHTSLVENSMWQQSLISVSQGGMIFGDYDNDGDLDIVLMGCCDYLRTYTNNGTSFSQSQNEDGFVGGGLFAGSIAFGDYDNDGYLDFAGIGQEEGRDRVYKNDGDGRFTANTLTGINLTQDDFQQGALAWNDLDNDNDLDLIVIGIKYTTSIIDATIYLNNASLTSNNSVPSTPINFSNSTLSNGDVFLSWGNGSDNQTPSNGLYYNLRVGSTSAGNQIVSGVYGGSSGGEWRGGGPTSGYFGNMMQRKNISLKASRFQVGVTYYWSVQTIDTALAKSEWSTEKTFNLTSDFTPPIITLNIPADNLVTNATSITFNATVVDDYNLTNVSLYGNWSGGWHKNTTNSSGINNTNYIFRNNLTEGTHLWGIRACDNTANCVGTNQTFRIDITSPIVNLISPTNGSSWTTSNTVNFTYNVSDLGIQNCSLMINELTNRTNTSILVNQTQNFTTNLPNGNYNWSIKCVDQANNVNFTGNYSLTVSYTAPSEDNGGSSSSGGSGGGGGGGTSSLNIVSRIIPSVIVGENTVTLTETEKKNTGIEEIIINSNSALNNAKLIVEKMKNKPADVEPDPQGDVYSYLRFDKTILTDNNLESAIIKFMVNRSWVLENNYQAEDVALSHYTTSWNKLPTKFLSSDSILYHYEAETKGFSYFAVAAESNKQNKTIQEIDNATEIGEPRENTNVGGNLTPEEIVIKPFNYRLIGFMSAAFILLAIISIYFFLKMRSNKTKK